MPDSDSNQTGQTEERQIDKGRRNLLFLLPVTIFGGLAATIVTAAYRFLRPTKPSQQERWNDVSSLAELKGDRLLGDGRCRIGEPR